MMTEYESNECDEKLISVPVKLSLFRKLKMKRIESKIINEVVDLVDTIHVGYIDELVKEVVYNGGSILDPESRGMIPINSIENKQYSGTIDPSKLTIINKIMISRWGLKIIYDTYMKRCYLSKCCIADGDYDHEERLIFRKNYDYTFASAKEESAKEPENNEKENMGRVQK